MGMWRPLSTRYTHCFNWAASGNVICISIFHDSDAQWHPGKTSENPIEQYMAIVNSGNAAYGSGRWGSPPENAVHSPAHHQQNTATRRRKLF